MVRHDSNSDPPARPSKRPPQGVCGLRHAFRGVRVPVCYRQGALLHSAPPARAMLDGMGSSWRSRPEGVRHQRHVSAVRNSMEGVQRTPEPWIRTSGFADDDTDGLPELPG